MRPPRSLGSVRRPHGQMAEYGMKLADRGITLQRHLAHFYILGNDRGEVHTDRANILAPSAMTLNGPYALLS
ncbi:hypothetical protein OKW44_001565 [Paraburkholderia sp. WSM4174]